MNAKKAIHAWMRWWGYDLVRYRPESHFPARRSKLLKSFGISTVLDVGANAGQYGRLLRDVGYRGRIISFEPLSSAYGVLKSVAARDGAWQALNIALGEEDGGATINIARNSLSSSILPMTPVHEVASPESKYVGREEVEVRRLDSLIEQLRPDRQGMLLKLDAQGYEKKIIEGAEKSLALIDTVEVELSLVPLYEGQALLSEVCEMLFSRGYQWVSIEPVFTDSATGRLLQIDCMFHRFPRESVAGLPQA
ncbi:MAG: FkbM family methyltransferase [bacterium]